MRSAPHTLGFTLLAVTGLFGCTATTTGSNVAIQLQPPSADVLPGGSVSFAAVVTGASDTAVTWSIQEGAAGGSVSSTGVYTAPAIEGTYHVVATSQEYAAKSGRATVKVHGVRVAISPTAATLAAGGAEAFAATVTPSSVNTSVLWSVQEISGCGSVTTAGLYTAPGAAATCHVVATSQADPTQSAVATVMVTVPPPPVAVAITPPSAAINSCQSATFTATVTGTTNTAVTWSVQEGSAGGTVTAAGVYTAPSSAGTYHVVATSQADPTKSAVATVTVTDKILSVAVAPSSTSVPAGGTVQFTASVTTTCGTFTSTLAVGAVN